MYTYHLIHNSNLIKVTYEGRERFSQLIKRLVAEAGSKRAFARSIGVTSTAVTGWEECRSMPEFENLIHISEKSGYKLEELQFMLFGKSINKSSDFDQVIKQIESMPPKQLVKISKVVTDRLYAIAESVG